MDRNIAAARVAARRAGLDWASLAISTRAGKRFMIKGPNGWVHFGSWPFSGLGTFVDHGNVKVRDAWQRRHAAIKTKAGRPAHLNPDSPSYYAWNVLW